MHIWSNIATRGSGPNRAAGRPESNFRAQWEGCIWVAAQALPSRLMTRRTRRGAFGAHDSSAHCFQDPRNDPASVLVRQQGPDLYWSSYDRMAGAAHATTPRGMTVVQKPSGDGAPVKMSYHASGEFHARGTGHDSGAIRWRSTRDIARPYRIATVLTKWPILYTPSAKKPQQRRSPFAHAGVAADTFPTAPLCGVFLGPQWNLPAADLSARGKPSRFSGGNGAARRWASARNPPFSPAGGIRPHPSRRAGVRALAQRKRGVEYCQLTTLFMGRT